MEWKYTYMILVKSAIFQLNAISHRCKEPRCCTLPVGKALKHKAMQLFWGFHIPIADQRSVVITWEWNGSTIGWVWVIHIQGNKSNRVESSFMLVLTNLTYRNKCSSIRDTSCRHKNPIGWMCVVLFWSKCNGFPVFQAKLGTNCNESSSGTNQGFFIYFQAKLRLTETKLNKGFQWVSIVTYK